MHGYTRTWRPVVAAIGCCMVVACTSTGSSTATQAPPQAAAPQIAGAWYQVYFDSNKDSIDARGNMIIAKAADLVRHNDDVRVTVIGKTDRIGNPGANMALSEARAERVRDALIGSGVPSGRIDTSWVGERKQDLQTADNVAAQRNRVVDVVVQLPN